VTEAVAAAQLAERSEGQCALAGALTLETVPWLWRELQQTTLLDRAREADLSGVDQADSAGLALIITWRARCKSQGGELRLTGVPTRLLALARLTGAEGLLAQV
jgi:phospholipid transport system transporter-binding protein